MNYRVKSFLWCAVLAAALTACGDDSNPDSLTPDTMQPADSLPEDTQARLENAQNIFYSIPSPVEMATLLNRAGADYNYTYLNDVEKVNSYADAGDQALNLGVYGADLSYTSIFNETNESMLYMKAAQILSDKLDVSAAIDDRLAERIETNIEYKDSMMVLISEVYWNLDNYLKNSGRDNISALIISGGWLEGLYLTTRLLETAPDDRNVQEKIAEQKFGLDNLVSLLEQYGEDEMLAPTLDGLKELESIYEQVTITRTPGENSIDAETGVMVIGGSNEIVIDAEVLQQIKTKIEEIRARIIQ